MDDEIKTWLYDIIQSVKEIDSFLEIVLKTSHIMFLI